MISDDLKRKTVALRERHILDAAITVFKRDGYRAATIRSIAREAGVSDGTIYNVFDNKEALLFAALHALLGGLHGADGQPGAATEMMAGASIEQLFLDRWRSMDSGALEIVRIIWSEALQDRALAARYLRMVMQPALERFPQTSRTSEAEGPEPAADAVMMPRVAIAMFLGLVLLKALGDPVLESSGDKVAALASDILGRGLQSPGHGE
jgi:AcrR family transcriptional regulator